MQADRQSSEASFLDAIREHPEDLSYRLVYSDWLEEQGEQDRAEYLRLECPWAKVLVPTELRCSWKGKLPPIEDRYPLLLRKLSEKAQTIDLGWLTSISLISMEIRKLIEQFSQRIPLEREVQFNESTETISESWKKSIGEITKMFTKYTGETYTQEQFRIPIDYALFASELKTSLYVNDEYGMSYFDLLWASDDVAKHTISFCQMYAKDQQEGSHLFQACGLWLFVGNRDKHDFHLCCDSSHPLFGTLVDQHDDHPWLYLSGASSWEVQTRSFLDFLRWQVKETEQEPNEE
jgi:uncharacterized protein (TIGR02996 family)